MSDKFCSRLFSVWKIYERIPLAQFNTIAEDRISCNIYTAPLAKMLSRVDTFVSGLSHNTTISLRHISRRKWKQFRLHKCLKNWVFFKNILLKWKGHGHTVAVVFLIQMENAYSTWSEFYFSENEWFWSLKIAYIRKNSIIFWVLNE